MQGGPLQASGDAGGVAGAEPGSIWWHRFRKLWPWLRYVIGLGLAVLALWALAGRRSELAGATKYLAHLHWSWLVLAAAAEGGSLVAFGIIQRRLLETGHVRIGVGRITAVTFAVTAMANSMPAGPLVSSVFAYRQYRYAGADEAFAGWTLAAVFVAASVSLALVASAGLAIAGAEGAGFDLVWVTIGVLAAAIGFGALFLQRAALVWVATRAVLTCRRIVRWPSENSVARVESLLARLTLVRLTPMQVVSVTGWGLANWVLDCGCLALSFMAVGVGVPWKALLLAYGAGQLAVNLPITPGGLGVVEGSLTIALVAFGGAETQTVAAVLLYRIISFWAELPLGWATWAGITWGHHLHSRTFPDPVAVGMAGPGGAGDPGAPGGGAAAADGRGAGGAAGAGAGAGSGAGASGDTGAGGPGRIGGDGEEASRSADAGESPEVRVQ